MSLFTFGPFSLSSVTLFCLEQSRGKVKKSKEKEGKGVHELLQGLLWLIKGENKRPSNQEHLYAMHLLVAMNGRVCHTPTSIPFQSTRGPILGRGGGGRRRRILVSKGSKGGLGE